jgi:hypothetical protein
VDVAGMRASSPRDAGGIVIGWLTKLVVATALVGLCSFDAISIGVAKVSASDDASAAVQAASSAWQNSRHNIEAAYQAAQESLPDHVSEEVLVRGFSIDTDGTVHLAVRKTARTLLLFRVSKLAHLAVVTATGTGKSLGS